MMELQVIDLSISLFRLPGTAADGPLWPHDSGHESPRRAVFSLQVLPPPVDSTEQGTTDVELTADVLPDATPHLQVAPPESARPVLMPGDRVPTLSDARYLPVANDVVRGSDGSSDAALPQVRQAETGPVPAGPTAPGAPHSDARHAPSGNLINHNDIPAVPTPRALLDLAKAAIPLPPSMRTALSPSPQAIPKFTEGTPNTRAPDTAAYLGTSDHIDLRRLSSAHIPPATAKISLPGPTWRDTWRDVGKSLSDSSLSISQLSTAGAPTMATQASPAPPPLPIVAQISAQISGAATPGVIDLRLTPAELGPVRIIMHAVDGDMMVSIIADNPQTLDLMRRNSDMLLQEFRNLGHANVAFQFSGGGQRQDHQAPDASNIQPQAEVASLTPTIITQGIKTDGLDLRL